MKKIVLTFAMTASVVAFAQKKEIAAAFKAAESNDVATVNSQIAAADNAVSGKQNLIEPSLLEQYYYAKGFSLIKSGKLAEGAEYLAKINDLAKSKIYTGKDASKNKVYIVGKAAADASGIAGLKEESYMPTTGTKLAELVNPLVSTSSDDALKAYNAKDYKKASTKFLETYNLLKAAGGQNFDKFLYYGAISNVLGDNKTEAINLYKKLVDAGYTGIETSYLAKDKKSGQVVNLGDKATWELMKKNPDYSDFKTETTPSVEQEIYETLASLYNETDQYSSAIPVCEKGLAKFPMSKKLADSKGHAYFKSGKTDEFMSSLKDQLSKNPNDAVAWYNLGVLQSKNPATTTDAENSFKKAIELDPKMNNAYQNLVFVLMGDDDAAVSQYNKLRKEGKPDQANKIMDARRERFQKAIPVAEKWYANDSNNIDVVSLLKQLYISTHNDAKVQEFKAKEAALKK